MCLSLGVSEMRFSVLRILIIAILVVATLITPFNFGVLTFRQQIAAAMSHPIEPSR